MFVTKTGAYTSEVPFRCSTLGPLAFPTNIILGWKAFAKNKHSSLLRIFVNYGCKFFYNIGYRLLTIKRSTDVIYGFL
jgi:hypothetical protein